jgi:hypothetical protein
MSIITGSKKKAVDFQAIQTIKEWLLKELDEEDLNVPVRINNLARKTRSVAKITDRANQPYFENYVLKPLEDEGICNINEKNREVTFLVLPGGPGNTNNNFLNSNERKEGMAILPFELREEIWELKDEGYDNKAIFDIIYPKASKYVDSDKQLKKCIGSICGAHTKGLRPNIQI